MALEADTPDLFRGSPSPRERRVALGRAGAFWGLAIGLTGAALLFSAFVLKLKVDPEATGSLTYVVLAQIVLALTTAIVPTIAIAWINRTPMAAIGWARSNWGRQLASGAMAGFTTMTALVALIECLGGATIHPSQVPWPSMIRAGGAYMAIFALTAISEEGLFRGLSLVQLSRALSFWPAAFLSSLLFIALHLGHKSETLAGLAQVGAMGLLLAFSFRRFGALWFAVGLHTAWDFTETFVLGAPDSGMPSAGSLFQSTFNGPAWLTGGSAGPEGSWLVYPLLALLGLLIRASTGNRRRPRT